MQLASVLLARFFPLVPIEDLNQKGTVYYPELTAALVDRYGFIKYPQKAEEFDESKGIEFIGGRSGKRVIEKLVLQSGGIYLDTHTHTEASESLWFELMDWAIQTFGATFKPEMIKRRAYVSHLTFHTDVPILALNSVLSEIANVTTNEVESNFGQHLDYESTGIILNFDQLTSKNAPASFTVQRREGVLFGENKYFSSAPLKTNIHINLLEGLENALRR